MDTLDKLILKIALCLVLAGLLLSVISTTRTNAGTEESSEKSSPNDSTSTLSPTDQQFIRRTATNSMIEVELGKLAGRKASNRDVRKYGQQMVDDHNKASDHLKQLAARKNLLIAHKPPAAASRAVSRMSRFSGQQFDNAYMAENLRVHKRDVEDFRRESKTTHDRDIRGFVAETLPILEDHLKKAETIAPDVKAERDIVQRSSAGKTRL